MKIAIAYDKNSKNVGQHFGETENFLIYEVDNKIETIVDNGGYSHHELVNYLASLGVNVLICGGIGRPAIGFFAQVKIVVYPGVTGSAKDALNQYLNGTLKGDANFVHDCGCHHE